MKTFLALSACLLALTSVATAATCTPTGFVRDSINMTAVLINPTGTVSGDIDATGCNIGVFYNNGKGTVNGATIHGANYFGVVVDGDNANVTVTVANSNVHNIGDVPFSGDQHGVGIYYRAFGTGTATGKITRNTVSQYQKGGIVVNGASTADVTDNIVTGLGQVDFIAGNGIQVGFGGTAQVMRNTVTGNAYTGLNFASSGGILVVGGDCYGGAFTTGTQIVGNTMVNNDVGAYISNLPADCVSPPATSTNIKIVNNTITNDSLSNLSGDGSVGYQAGVSDVGNGDKIINDTIAGAGYTAPGNGTTIAFSVDTTDTANAKVHAIK